MKTIIKTTLIALIAITVISCGNKTEKKETPSKKTEQQETHQHKSEQVIQLNGGNPWNANIETTQGIENMKKLMNDFSDTENTEAYLLLKSNLEKEFGTIISECTMEGESHNQLHNYLVPMRELFKDLASKDLQKCKETYAKLNQHLAEYSTYFK